MIEWFRTQRSRLVPWVSGVCVAALVTTVAVVSSGFTAQRFDLGDAAVWVAGSEHQAIGRVNTEVLELNTVVASAGTDLDVVQDGASVLLVDNTENRVDIVDPATSTVVDGVPLPPNRPEVFLAGDTVVIHERGTGDVWTGDVASLKDFDAESEPRLSLGLGAEVSVSSEGTLAAWSPSTSVVYTLVVTDPAATAISSPLTLAGEDVAVTSVGSNWVVLDRASSTVHWPLGSAEIEAGATGSVLQLATGDGDSVALATAAGFFSIRLDGGEVSSLVSDVAGLPTRPLVLGGCLFAAWADGTLWRSCGGAEGERFTLAELAGSTALSFKVNGDRALLADARSGRSWAVQRGGELIDNWDDLVSVDENDEQEEQNDDDVEVEIDVVQQPPVAVDDVFGARPGRATVLPVLLNDYDPNGDVLVVSEIGELDPAVGRIDLIGQRQQLQLTLTPEASGSFTFPYTITDGRGGSASATVTIEVRSAGENSPPVQVRSTQVTVGSGGRVTTDVLGDWVDPDGDPFYLASAGIAAPDVVVSKPGGTIVYADSGAGGDLKTIALVVSDGTAEAGGSVTVRVHNGADVPIVADPFVVLAYADKPVVIEPLDHVRGGSGTLRLNSVPAKADVTIEPSYESGTFRFTSSVVRTHYLDYVVTDGTLTVTGTIRVDVVAQPEANTMPITVPKTVFVASLRNERVDVTATDVDPAGGVLLVTGITNVPPRSGVRAEVLEQRFVRVSLEAPLEGHVRFNYRVSNGLAEAEGEITVIEIAAPARIQPPIATDDQVTVRTGQAIDIPVLDNDEHPDGLELTLDPTLVEDVPNGSGLLFASGGILRYLAPEASGNVAATYRVTGPDGQSATAVVRIAVREPDVATNGVPVPEPLTARVLAGETVRIPVPLSGIDPDGDSVQLLGQGSNPERGTVVDVEADAILYRAGEYSAGTDTFTYTVIDSLGARATGTVRVGISPRMEGARNPVAIVDEVRVRPGVTVSVQVLVNDSDPDGSPLRVISAEPNDEVTAAEIDGDLVRVTPGRLPGDYGVIYAIENETGGTSQNFIRVTVDPDAPLAHPRVTDSVLTLGDILGRETVTVDVLSRVFFADGDPRSLGLSVYPGYEEAARLVSGKRIEVTIGDRAQIIPFALTHPDDRSVVSYAFIRVPGSNDALPQLDKDAPALTVVSEQQLVIELSDYVIAVGDNPVRLTDSSTVQATHSNGASLVRDAGTLVFTSADRYFGPASISFEVTDGASASDPQGRTAVLVLPITVTPRENQPPVFTGAAIEFEPGQEKQIDLLKLTNYPYPDDLDELAYAIVGAVPGAFTHALNGTTLSLRAADAAPKGATAPLEVSVRDEATTGSAGRIQLTIVASSRPLARPAPDSAVVRRGESTTLDVLANDSATNPFPATPLRVTAIRGLDGGALPAGVQITPSTDRSSLAISVSSSATPGDTTLQYQVADATNDADRTVWGSVRVSVQDVPDQPQPPTRQSGGFAPGTLTLRYSAPVANNSAITRYEIQGTDGYRKDCGLSTACTLTDLIAGKPYVFQLVAYNEIGASTPSASSESYSLDYLPDAPAAPSVRANDTAPAGGGITIEWAAVSDPNPGSPVTGYTIEVVSGGQTWSHDVQRNAAKIINTAVLGKNFTPGTPVEVRVYARNSAQNTAASDWIRSASTTVTAVGPPSPAAVSAAMDGSEGDIVVTRSDSTNTGGAIVYYEFGRLLESEYSAGSMLTCSPGDGPGSRPGSISLGTGNRDTTAADGSTYVYIVYAENDLYCTVSVSAPIEAKRPPGVATGAVETRSMDDGRFEVFVAGAPTVASGIANRFQASLDAGATWRDIADGDRLTTGGSYGSSINVTFRGCRDSSSQYCGPASAPVTGTPITTVVTAVVCEALDPAVAPIISRPANEGTFVESYEVSYLGPFGLLGAEAWTDPMPGTDPVPAGAKRIRVQATVDSYTNPGYNEFRCTTPPPPIPAPETPDPENPGPPTVP